MKLQLRKYIRNILKESMVSQLTQDFAIIQAKGDIDGEERWAVVLWNVAEAKQYFEDLIYDSEDEYYNVDPEDDESPDIDEHVMWPIYEAAYAAIRLRPANSSIDSENDRTPQPTTGPCLGVWEIIRLASRSTSPDYPKPTARAWPLKDIMMGVSPKGTMPDRNSLSDDAVDSYVKSAAMGKYELTPFDDIDNPKTPYKFDDCVVWGDYFAPKRGQLDNAYNLPYDSRWDVLLDNAKKFFEWVEKHPFKSAFAGTSAGWTLGVEDIMEYAEDIETVDSIVADIFDEVYERDEE